MLRLLIVAPLVWSALSLEVAGQGDDEFDFDRRPRRPAPIPDDFDEPRSGGPSVSTDRPPVRSRPGERRREPPTAGRRQRGKVPTAAADLPHPPPKFVFAGYRGTFSVIGGSGQAAYQRQRQSFLVGLRYVRRDERFSYWSASTGDPEVGQWAFSRRAGPDGRHTVWQRTRAGWQYFDLAHVSKPR